MVEKSGTGGYTPDIPVRVTHLEGSVERLHSDNAQTQRTLAGVVSQLESLKSIMSDIGSKLDRTRTAKTPWIAICSVAIAAIMLVLTIGAMAASPVYRWMSVSEQAHKNTMEWMLESAAQHGRDRADLEALQRDNERINRELLLMRAGR